MHVAMAAPRALFATEDDAHFELKAPFDLNDAPSSTHSSTSVLCLFTSIQSVCMMRVSIAV